MITEEQKLKNIESHKARGIEDVFEDESLDYPTKIIFNSPTYGKYVLRPFFYINLMSDTPKAMSDVLELIHDMSPTKSAWNIKVITRPDYPSQFSIEFIYYLIDWDSNLDWKENNLTCKYLKDVPNAKFLPLVSRKDMIKIQEIWEKYPMTRIDNYITKN